MVKRNKLIAIVLTVLFIVAFWFSLDFISRNSHHDCTGTDCPICATLHIVEELSGGAKKTSKVSLLFTFCFVDITIKKVKKQFFANFGATPVSLRDILRI